MKVTGKQFTNNFLWKALEQFGTQFVTLTLSIILARILEPKYFGIISLTALFISFLDLFVQGGFNTAILQKVKVDKLDYSTATFLSLIMAIVMYTLIFWGVLLVADYYKTPQLIPVMRVLALTIFFNAINALLYASALKNMNVKLSFISNMISGLVSGTVGIVMALNGAGVWSLVVQKLIQQVIITLVLSISLNWRFSIKFSAERAKELFHFSVKVFGGSIVAFISDNSYSAIIGKTYSTEKLGLCDKGDQLPRSLILNIVLALTGVSLPTMSSCQNDLTKLKEITRKILRISYYIIFPMAVGLIMTAHNVVLILFTEKWLGSVSILQIMCMFYLTTPLLQICGQALYAIGKSEVRFWSEILKMILTLVTLAILIIIFKVDILVVIAMKTIISMFMILWTSIFTKRYFNYKLLEQLSDIFPSLIMSVIMGVILSGISVLSLNIYISLLLQVCTGIASYLLCSILFKNSAFYETMSIVRMYVKKNS